MEMSKELIGHYPTDPTGGMGDIMKYFQNGDQKYLLHGLYTLGGYVLGLAFGEPADHVDPAIVADSAQQLQKAMDAPGAQIKLPDWAKPLLKAALTVLLTWLQGQAVMMSMKKIGKISAFMTPETAVPPVVAAEQAPAPAPAEQATVS
jgi:hypothetical protein